MMRELVCAAAAVLCLAPAQAAVQAYEWSFTGGFLELESGVYEINTTIKGHFSVDDLNSDGQFDKSELVSMEYRGYTYPACSQCTISWFSWTPGAAPDFYINRREDTDTSYYSETVWTGSSYGFFSGAYGGGEPYIGGGRWTGNVTWKVTPVPEPQTWLMLGAGLAAVGTAARRRRAR